MENTIFKRMVTLVLKCDQQSCRYYSLFNCYCFIAFKSLIQIKFYFLIVASGRLWALPAPLGKAWCVFIYIYWPLWPNILQLGRWLWRSRIRFPVGPIWETNFYKFNWCGCLAHSPYIYIFHLTFHSCTIL